MIIIDKTPYRSKTGEISLVGLVQGTLKYGWSWQQRLKAQEVAIAIIEKQLDSNFALLRNVTLPNTDIVLPLVLIGPPGVYLLNVIHERGVYKAKDDQWGSMIGDRFVPARVNQITRTTTFGRVLQVYLDRQGFKGSVVVESVLMAPDPGMQVESTRPAVRVVMSDALERFAASMGHARPTIDTPLGKDVVRAILVGKPAQVASAPLESVAKEDDLSNSFGGFAFDDSETDQESFDSTDQNSLIQPPAVEKEKPKETPKKAVVKKKKLLGLTTSQLAIAGIFLFITICFIVAAIIFMLTKLNG